MVSFLFKGNVIKPKWPPWCLKVSNEMTKFVETIKVVTRLILHAITYIHECYWPSNHLWSVQHKATLSLVVIVDDKCNFWIINVQWILWVAMGNESN